MCPVECMRNWIARTFHRTDYSYSVAFRFSLCFVSYFGLYFQSPMFVVYELGLEYIQCTWHCESASDVRSVLEQIWKPIWFGSLTYGYLGLIAVWCLFVILPLLCACKHKWWFPCKTPFVHSTVRTVGRTWNAYVYSGTLGNGFGSPFVFYCIQLHWKT